MKNSMIDNNRLSIYRFELSKCPSMRIRDLDSRSRSSYLLNLDPQHWIHLHNSKNLCENSFEAFSLGGFEGFSPSSLTVYSHFQYKYQLEWLEWLAKIVLKTRLVLPQFKLDNTVFVQNRVFSAQNRGIAHYFQFDDDLITLSLS